MCYVKMKQVIFTNISDQSGLHFSSLIILTAVPIIALVFLGFEQTKHIVVGFIWHTTRGRNGPYNLTCKI